MKIEANGITHEVETFGRETDPAVVLIHGMGAQLTMWPVEEFCLPLARAGWFVIRYDVRDSGQSTQLDELGDPDILAALSARAKGEPLPPPPYSAGDMANDAVLLLNAMGIAQAHFIGFSMGGVIAQHIGLSHADRALSLTLIATNSGDPDMPQASAAVAAKFMQIPDDFWDKEQIVAKSLGILSVLKGSRDRIDPNVARARISANFDRWHNPPASHRLTAAIMAETDRTPQLRKLHIPTLVIHGSEDQMVPIENGVQLAAVIESGQLCVVDGMGHMLSAAIASEILSPIKLHLSAAA